MSKQSWWQNAVIYQIYPRSFYDANGDGVGDLKGILKKLDYVADLGVDAIWISPFFKSPMKDFGYDISDYRGIDPLFGNMADFDKLMARAHDLNLKVMIDQVLSHTSDEHPWFQESRMSKHNDKADWYVWADPKADGTPPNNWLAIFGGPAWQWDESRCQYYFHNFLTSQPDLNFHNPQVREQMLNEMRFWLDKGVDGFRLDAINYCFHDVQLRDNPVKPDAERKGRGFSEKNPYAAQQHLYDNTQPENLAFMSDIRKLLDEYPGSVALGEINSDDSLQSIADYTTEGKLHVGYSFELLATEFSTDHIAHTVNRSQHVLDERIPCWAISNHDVTRVVTRWGQQISQDANKDNRALAKLFTSLVLSLRGTVCTYQGEELGLPEHDIQKEFLQDPFGINFWPEFKGRDGCRTPMPWTPEAHGGFSQAAPWLPLDDKHLDMSVLTQQADGDSTLNHYKTFLRWRKQQPAIMDGVQSKITWDEHTLQFTRTCGKQALYFCFNLSSKPADVRYDLLHRLETIEAPFVGRIVASANGFTIPPLSFYCAAVLPS